MSLRTALLTFRIQRFETTVVVGATILSVLVSAAVVGWFTAGGYGRCITDESLALTSLCQAGVGPWLFRIARLSFGIVPVFPVVAGLLVGGPIVARELETGTARLAWSLGPSRLRWFLHRAVPALLMVVLAAVAIGLTADALMHVNEPGTNLDQSFVGFRSRGLLIPVEALLVASIALAIGSILGRAIPTLVLTLVLVGGISIAVDKVEREVLTNEALVSSNFEFTNDNLYLDSRFQLPDGQIVTYQELAALHPEINQDGFDPELYRNVELYIPGTRYHEVELREAIALAAIASVFLVLGAVTVIRRRPR